MRILSHFAILGLPCTILLVAGPAKADDRLFPAISASAAGGWVGYTLGKDAGWGRPVLNAPLGMALGAGLSLPFAPHETPGNAARSFAWAAEGAYIGRQIGRTLVPFHTANADAIPAYLSAGGDALGLGLSWGLRRSMQADPRIWHHTLVGTAVGHLGGQALAGQLGISPLIGRSATTGLELGGGLLIGTVSLLGTHRELRRDPAQTTWSAWAPEALGTAAGATIGSSIPNISRRFSPTTTRNRAAILGGSIGFGVASIVPVPGPSPLQTAGLGLGGAAGGATTYGLASLFAPDPRVPTALGLAGGLGGSAWGWVATRELERASDGAPYLFAGGELLAVAEAGLWHIWATERRAYPTPQLQTWHARGAALGAWGLTNLGTLGTALHGSPDPTDAAWIASTTGWGAWLGLSGGLVGGAPRPTHALLVGLGAWTGATTGALTWRHLDWNLSRIAWFDTGGLIGAGLGFLTFSADAISPRTRYAASLGGSLIGGSISAILPGSGFPRREARVSPTSAPHSPAHFQYRHRQTLPFSFDLRPWQAPSGAEGFYLGVESRHARAIPPAPFP